MKTCTICKQSKEVGEFNRNCTRRDEFQDICRECSKNRSKKYYSDNKEKHKEDVHRRRINTMNIVRSYKGRTKCSNCGESHIATLDFHHLDPNEKEVSISTAIHHFGWSLKRVIKESEKCIVLCSNCHRKLEWKIRMEK
jgi:hypothetical protein